MAPCVRRPMPTDPRRTVARRNAAVRAVGGKPSMRQQLRRRFGPLYAWPPGTSLFVNPFQVGRY